NPEMIVRGRGIITDLDTEQLSKAYQLTKAHDTSIRFRAYSEAGTDNKIQIPSGKDHLIILDGKEISVKKMEKIRISNIKSIRVLKQTEGEKAYGEKGKGGVIIINQK